MSDFSRFTRFIGREHEINLLGQLLLTEKLNVLLTGEAGVGKSRLAWQTAKVLRAHFADGITTFTFSADRPEQECLVEMAGRLTCCALLLVDGLDDHGQAKAALAALSGGGFPARVLACARSGTGLTGLAHMHIEGLPLPVENQTAELACSPAVILYVNTVRLSQPDYQPDNQELLKIAALCRKAEGNPRKIILAAEKAQADERSTGLHNPLRVEGFR